MTVVARRVCATPARSASEAWTVIMDLLAPSPASAARRELEAIAGIASGLIADEAMTAPIVTFGSGPRVRIYCLYDEEAISGEDANETPLAFDATSVNWHMSLPCPPADLAWVQAALATRSDLITARDQYAPVDDSETDEAVDSRATSEIVVDQERFFRS